MKIHTTPSLAVQHSAANDERAWLQTDETESGREARCASTLSELVAYGLEDSCEHDNGSIEAKGVLNGTEWYVLIVDLLERDAASYR